MKLPAGVGPCEARLLAEVVGELSGGPAPPPEGAVDRYLEQADPAHLLEAARHLSLRQPKRFPPTLLESLARQGARSAPRLHQLVLPTWEPQGIRAEGSLADRLRRLPPAFLDRNHLAPDRRDAIGEERARVLELLEAALKGGHETDTLVQAIEELARSFDAAFQPPDLAANPWGESGRELWAGKVEDALRVRDGFLAWLRALLAIFAPERSAALALTPSGAPELFPERKQAVKLGTRARRDVALAHDAVARRLHADPSGVLPLSKLLSDLAGGHAASLRHLAGALEVASQRVLLESSGAAQELSRRLQAVLRHWPRPADPREREDQLATAQAAIARIAGAWLEPGEGPLGAPIARVLWTKAGTMHKVALDDGSTAFVRLPVQKLRIDVHPGNEMGVALLHRALGSDRAPMPVQRRDGEGRVRTLTPEVPGYRSRMEAPFSLTAMLQGTHHPDVAVVAFVDLISGAIDLHDANLGLDGAGRMIAIDRELSFCPGEPLPGFWCGVRSLQFPRVVIETARSWTLADLRDILAPAQLPPHAAEETFTRLQELLRELDGEGRLHFQT